MTEPIFLIGRDGSLVEMREQAYDSEDVLQELLARYPNVLAARGSAAGPEPTRWLLLFREAEVPDNERLTARWSVDHLFIDQDAVPTFVEVKRSTDTRIRREVVGQMLDYAANALEFLTADELRARFAAVCDSKGLDADEEVRSALGIDPDALWTRLVDNLRIGRLRLVFVADAIPDELRRIVEFLNAQMDRTEVIAIEVRQFLGKQGEETIRTLVPRMLGRTVAAERAKAAGESRRWTEDTILEALAGRSPGEASAAAAILSWAHDRGLRFWFGRGHAVGSVYPVLDLDGQSLSTFALWTDGKVALQIAEMRKREPFSDPGMRAEFRARILAIPGVVLATDRLEKYPSFPITVLADPGARATFLTALDWALDSFESHQQATHA